MLKHILRAYYGQELEDLQTLVPSDLENTDVGVTQASSSAGSGGMVDGSLLQLQSSVSTWLVNSRQLQNCKV